ncbi:Hypothetical predicted protein [Cloeon dipterum]|uniref:Carbohydrate sulfotransferase n=1 Tax=Cloeon dipterum TaxID=197152 RepID=A0A8S1CAK6_9INSE|nr:Hypothetical predicted protein [Cloeon dipterum]
MAYCSACLATMRTPRILRLLVLAFVSVFLLLFYRNFLIGESHAPLTTAQKNELLKEAEADMNKRRVLIERVCTKYNLGLYRNSAEPQLFKHPPTPQYSVFYIDKQHKMSYCPIYKAASTTWLHQMLILSGRSEQSIKSKLKVQQLSEQAREVYPVEDSDQVEEALRTNLKLVIVRHPFERLLSAYRDKLENINVGLEHGVEYFYKSHGRKIVKKYRNETSSRLEPTFREFVSYLIKEDPIRYNF